MTDTDGDTVAPKAIDGLDAVTVIGRVATVIVCAELVATKYEASAALVAVTAHVEPATPVTDNVEPEIEQPAVPAVVTAYVTAPLPEPPDVESVNVSPKATLEAEDIDNVAWAALFTVTAVLVLAVNAEPEATVAVMVGVPEVHRVTANALVPETSAALEGSTAAESVDVIAIVWVAVDTRFQFASTALTVAESAVPAV